MTPFVSICVPSYNRPEQLFQLLSSVDATAAPVEIVICEDRAPRRAEVADQVRRYTATSRYDVRYIENVKNYGYDRNLRELIQNARGEFVLFMGDDDEFVPGQLDRFIEYLKANPDLGYVLRSYRSVHENGSVELFRYFDGNQRFAPGEDAYVALFRRSVTIAGFTFRRALAADFLTDRFDGTLLYQLYLMAELTLRHPSGYCDVPVASVTQTFRLDKPQFGASDAEKGLFEPGKVTPRNSVNFMKGFFKITRDIDEHHGLRSTDRVRQELSKYSYPILSIQRKRGLRAFIEYIRLLDREVGINRTLHYYVYAAALILLGEGLCDRLIVRFKRVLGRTPHF